MEIFVEIPDILHPNGKRILRLVTDEPIHYQFRGSFNWIGQINGKTIRVHQPSISTSSFFLEFDIDPSLEDYIPWIKSAIDKALNTFD
jgi:hypothetical protein